MHSERVHLKPGTIATLAAITLLGALPASVRMQAAEPGRQPVIITFDAPGAVNGTSPNSINPAGAITGS